MANGCQAARLGIGCFRLVPLGIRNPLAPQLCLYCQILLIRFCSVDRLLRLFVSLASFLFFSEDGGETKKESLLSRTDNQSPGYLLLAAFDGEGKPGIEETKSDKILTATLRI